jgi:hypothetical protein
MSRTKTGNINVIITTTGISHRKSYAISRSNSPMYGLSHIEYRIVMHGTITVGFKTISHVNNSKTSSLTGPWHQSTVYLTSMMEDWHRPGGVSVVHIWSLLRCVRNVYFAHSIALFRTRIEMTNLMTGTFALYRVEINVSSSITRTKSWNKIL